VARAEGPKGAFGSNGGALKRVGYFALAFPHLLSLRLLPARRQLQAVLLAMRILIVAAPMGAQ